jgi:hypothetical protein
MAWSPARRANAGVDGVGQPGDYATLNSNPPRDGTDAGCRVDYRFGRDGLAAEKYHRRALSPGVGHAVRVEVAKRCQNPTPALALCIDEHDEIGAAVADKVQDPPWRRVRVEHVDAHYSQRRASRRRGRAIATEPEVSDRPAVQERYCGEGQGSRIGPAGKGSRAQEDGEDDVVGVEVAEQVEHPPEPGRKRARCCCGEPCRGERKDGPQQSSPSDVSGPT